MITTVDITLLPDGLRDRVLTWYKLAITREDHLLSIEEAAWLYGYHKATLRWYVYRGYIPSRTRKQRRYVTHAAMRHYIRQRKTTGRPRQALKNAQIRIPS